jgi:hypothetical protein
MRCAIASETRWLGYRLVAEAPDDVAAPAEIGIERIWRVDGDEWTHRIA